MTGAAYLHNATDLGVDGLFGLPPTDQSSVFTGQSWGLIRRVPQVVARAPVSGASAAGALMSSTLSPSKQLMALVAEEVQHESSTFGARTVWVLRPGFNQDTQLSVAILPGWSERSSTPPRCF